MPISSYLHVHYNRVYHVDARDRRKVRISSANDSADMTTDGATLDPIPFNFALGSQGDVLQSIGTSQRFIVFAGRKSDYVNVGTTPTADDAHLPPKASPP